MKKNNDTVEGPDGLVSTARLPLSSAALNWLADLIRGHMKEIGSRWRALPAGKIAGIVLARPGQGPHGSEVGDGAGAGPAGPHEQGSCPMADDLVRWTTAPDLAEHPDAHAHQTIRTSSNRPPTPCWSCSRDERDDRDEREPP
ncbi:hypothetical protein ACFYR1_34590 [Streptomyces canus]|uniref:hypothetical protein n=1 Tax=Streptomyces canus TaxID=58343 RepID=UPI0036CB6602